MTLLVRGVHDPTPLISTIRGTIASVDREMPLSQVSTMEQVLGESMAGRRFPTVLLSVFGCCALLLGAIGTYAVLSYSVAERTVEFGIRVALGAQRSHVMTLVLGRGLLLTGAGLAIGAVGALALSRFLSRLLFGVTATDPGTYVAVAAILLTAALLACSLPAWRATRVDPITALRAE